MVDQPSLAAPTLRTHPHWEVCARARHWPLLTVTSFLVAAGFASLVVDVLLADWLRKGGISRDVIDLLNRAEAFAYGINVAIILLIIFVVDVQRRWAMPRLIAAVALGGLSANIVKLMVWRTRPFAMDSRDGVLESFVGWFPVFRAGSEGQSTPSGHMALAVAFAIGLAWLFPRGRWIFATLAILAGCQRLVVGRHFLSDVFWGAAMGWFVSVGVIKFLPALAWFRRWEENLFMRFRGSIYPLPHRSDSRSDQSTGSEAA